MAETPVSFVNAMEGAAMAEKRQLDHATFTAWHTAVFAVQRYMGKLKALSHYLRGSDPSPKSQHAQAIAWAQQMQSKGFPVEITRVTRH